MFDRHIYIYTILPLDPHVVRPPPFSQTLELLFVLYFGPSSQSVDNLRLKASVLEKLGHVPHHSTGKGAESLRVLEDRRKLRARDVATTSTRARRNADEELDIGVRAGLGPVLPGLVVVVVLGAGAGSEAADATRVVVELNLDPIHGHSVDEGADSSVGEEALGSSREVILLAAGSVGSALQLGAKGSEVVGGCFKVEVEAIDDGTAKRTVDRASGLNGAEHGPDLISGRLSSTC